MKREKVWPRQAPYPTNEHYANERAPCPTEWRDVLRDRYANYLAQALPSHLRPPLREVRPILILDSGQLTIR